MTGRELIVYILENKLEDEPVFKDGKFIGFITAIEAAEKMGVGTPTVYTLLARKQLDGIVVTGNNIFIPANFESPLNKNTGERSN